MSQSILKFNENQLYNVANLQIKTSRQSNAHRPNSHPRCDEILLTVVSPGEDARLLLNWFIDNDSKDVELYINLHSSDYTDCERCFILTNTYCFSFEEVYDNEYSRRHLIQLGIVAGEQTLKKQDTKDYTINSF